MKAVFVDTVGLLAIWDRRDQWHSRAVPIFKGLLVQRARLFTSELILAECANAASRSIFRLALLDFRDEMLDANGILALNAHDLETAWEAYRYGQAGGPGVVDLVSFGLMRDYGITEAFTNDRHFRAAGFSALF